MLRKSSKFGQDHISRYELNQLRGAESFLSRYKSLRSSRNSSPFMELEGSLLCLQELATGPYPDSGECIPSCSFKIH